MSGTTHGITTGAVARLLGVSPATVRSWEQRYGIGPAERAEGRHRRWSADDVSMLEEMRRLTATGVPPSEAAHAALRVRSEAAGVSPGAPTERSDRQATDARTPGRQDAEPAARPGRAESRVRRGDLGQEVRALSRAAMRLEGPAMEVLLQRLLTEHGLVVAWEEVIAPTLRAVGSKWAASDDRFVEVEHLLSWQVSAALRRATVRRSEVSGAASPVVLACVPRERHTLSLEALAAGLTERGELVRMLGADVPAETLDAAVRRIGPAAVVLWAQTGLTADASLAGRIADTAFGVRGARTAPHVLLAGPGWLGQPIAPGASTGPSGLREALDVVCRLGQGHSPAALG
ncbi:DNA-binding transcriptional MerR regulator [Streptomyces sp. PvR006]|uniref:MerR family transcriptional regulator n=1 Tax=Streptomyces sp. PvR006 TaxID=2817860 RepID=UPI001AE58DC9|nr:MerR family transcriptional regulator [Streptomyces sp. PvR006]MBP2579738.1 DNA-binding transcriptional MerR regulator [Streptomyces sp. PvR006]